LCLVAGLQLGLGATTANRKKQQELRDRADEKEKGKQGGLATKQPGNLKLPSFREHITRGLNLEQEPQDVAAQQCCAAAANLPANAASKQLPRYTRTPPRLHDHCLDLQKLSTVETIAKRRLEVLHTPAPQARKQTHWTDSRYRSNHTTKHRRSFS